jgi:hypothetical protein
MTQLVLSTPRVVQARPRFGSARAVRYAAAATFAALGLLIASVGISFPIVAGLIASGRVAAPASELATFDAIAPFWGVVVLFGLLQIGGAAGSLERRRWGRALALVAALALLSVVTVSQVGVAIGAASMDPAGRAVAVALGTIATALTVAALLRPRDDA